MSSEKISLGLSIIGALTGVAGFIASIRANGIAKEANKLAKKQNKLIEETNKQGAQSIQLTQSTMMSVFDVFLKDISISNDAYLCASIEEAIQKGVIKCKFDVENKSPNDALNSELLHSRSGNRTNGKDIRGNSVSELDYSFHLSSVIDSRPMYNVTTKDPQGNELQKQRYSSNAYLVWDNATNTCSCKVKFEFAIEQYMDNGMVKCRVTKTGNTKCEISDYIMG